MSNNPFPVDGICYRIQNLDYGTFLGVVDQLVINSKPRKANLVVRARKEGIKTQEVTPHRPVLPLPYLTPEMTVDP
jgi:hypothetical protein